MAIVPELPLEGEGCPVLGLPLCTDAKQTASEFCTLTDIIHQGMNSVDLHLSDDNQRLSEEETTKSQLQHASHTRDCIQHSCHTLLLDSPSCPHNSPSCPESVHPVAFTCGCLHALFYVAVASSVNEEAWTAASKCVPVRPGMHGVDTPLLNRPTHFHACNSSLSRHISRNAPGQHTQPSVCGNQLEGQVTYIIAEMYMDGAWLKVSSPTCAILAKFPLCIRCWPAGSKTLTDPVRPRRQ